MQNDNAWLNLFIFPKCFEITLWVLGEEAGEFAMKWDLGQVTPPRTLIPAS